jgi:outer membrane protein
MLSAAAIVGCAVAPAHTETLQEETGALVRTSPALAAQRARLEATRDSLPLAWAELLPQISLEGDAIEHDQTEPNFFSTVRTQPEYWIATARVSTLLFGSGRVWSSTRQARAQIASAIAQYQNAIQDLAVELARAYGEVIYSHAALEAQQQSLANLEEQARFAAANLREGFLTRTDVAQADARVAQAHADLATANANVVAATEAYMRITGHPPGDLQQPAPLSDLPSSLDVALTMAEEHPALTASAARIRAAEAAVGLAASEGRLRVFLESSNSRFDVIDDSSPLTEQQDNTVNLRVSVPLFSGGATRARTRQQRRLRDASQYDFDDVQRRVREQVTVAWSNLGATRSRVEASRARLDAAEMAQRGVRREQQYGQRSMIDVLNQEQELLNARVAVAAAERDAMVAERTLAAASGQIAPLLDPRPRRR